MTNSISEQREQEAGGPGDDRDPKRKLCTGLLFWTVCGRKACRRAHACAGDARACFARCWPHVPEDIKLRIRVGIEARHAGMTAQAIERRIEAEVARWRAPQAPAVASPSPDAQTNAAAMLASADEGPPRRERASVARVRAL